MHLPASPGSAKALLAIFLAVCSGFLWLNLDVPTAGIVQDALLDETNPYLRAQRQADRIPGLRQGDAMSLVLDFPGGIDGAGMGQISRMTTDLRKRFPQGVVWSLAADSYAYEADALQVESAPHLSPDWLQDDGSLRPPMGLDAWKRRVAADPAAYGMLVARDFSHAQILLWMPKDYNEQQLVRELAEYLEQRSISSLEWLAFKGDIRPAAPYANVSVGGWSVGRGLMHYALMSDVLFYSTIGLAIATLAALLALNSLKQALYASTCILMSFILIRGTIGLSARLGIELHGAPLAERVYFLLVLSSMIVAGISFSIRALERFNELQRENPGTSHHVLWAQVERLNMPMNVAAAIAILNFLTLPQIGIRGIMEVGILSAIGILYLRILVSWMLPALQIGFGGIAGERALLNAGNLALRWKTALNTACAACHAAIVRLNRRHAHGAAFAAIAACTLTVAAAVGVVIHDIHADRRWIPVQEQPIDYLPDTIVDRGRQLLNRSGADGFGRLSYMVLPSSPDHAALHLPVTDPDFLRRAEDFQQRLAVLPGVRGVHSVLDTLSYLSSQDRSVSAPTDGRRPLPLSAQQVNDQLQQIAWDLTQPALADYLWTNDGLVLFLSHPADNSTELRRLAEEVGRIASQEFPELRVLPFGPLHSYHQTDLYVSAGKPVNVLTSLPLVIACCALWLIRRTRHDRGIRVLRPLPAAAAVAVPFLFAYAVVVLTMAAFSLPLDQATACATALGINAAIDFDIYLIDDYRHALAQGRSPERALHYALAERGAVTLTDATLNAICFSFLLGSAFIPIQRLGAVMLIMLATCVLGALLLMPAMLSLCAGRPRPMAAALPLRD